MDSYPWKGKTALVIANGYRVSRDKLLNLAKEAEIIIGVDGGSKQAIEAGLPLQLVIGDFDSIDPQLLERLAQGKTQISRFPPGKDLTDTELALKLASRSGVARLCLVSGIGSRLDHSLANVFLLSRYAESFSELVLESTLGRIYYLSALNPELELEIPPQTPFTLLPLSSIVEGVSISGAKYLLKDAQLVLGSTLGVSNEGTGGLVRVRISQGVCGVIVTNEVG